MGLSLFLNPEPHTKKFLPLATHGQHLQTRQVEGQTWGMQAEVVDIKNATAGQSCKFISSNCPSISDQPLLMHLHQRVKETVLRLDQLNTQRKRNLVGALRTSARAEPLDYFLLM